MALPLSQLAARCGAGRLNGDENTLITGVASLQTGGAQRLAFFSGGNLRALADTTAAAVVLRADDAAAIAKTPAGCAQWLVEGEPRAYFSRAIAQLYPAPAAEFAGVSAAAHIAPDARLGDEVAVAATAVIGAKAVIGAGSIIYPGAVIAPGVTIGQHCVLYPQVCLYPRVTLGDGCVIHAGTVIGADGFGYTAADGAGVDKIRQLGGVKIGNRVEVGANSAIDCGALDDTVIGDDVKIDNLVQIGHNVVIGEQTIICGKVGIAGSVVVGRCCVIGGGSGIADHLVIGDAVKIAGATSISRNVPAGEIMSSMMPAMPIRSWRRFVAGLRRRLGR